MAGLTAAERVAVAVVAREKRATRSDVHGRRVTLLQGGRRVALRVHSLQRTAEEIRLPAPRLRFDRVVLWLCRDLQAAAPRSLPDRSLAFVALRAPIRAAAKTVGWITDLWQRSSSRAPTGRVRARTVLGNHLRLGTLPAPRPVKARLLCLVHTHAGDAVRLLAMTRDLLRLAEGTRPRDASQCLVIVTPEPSALRPVYRHLYAALDLALPYREVFLVFGDRKAVRLRDAPLRD